MNANTKKVLDAFGDIVEAFKALDQVKSIEQATAEGLAAVAAARRDLAKVQGEVDALQANATANAGSTLQLAQDEAARLVSRASEQAATLVAEAKAAAAEIWAAREERLIELDAQLEQAVAATATAEAHLAAVASELAAKEESLAAVRADITKLLG